MNRLAKFALTLIFTVFLVGGFYLLTQWISNTTGYVIKSDDSEILSNCFKDREVKLYVSPNCAECTKQKNELSNVINGVEIVDCIQNQKDCGVLNSVPAIERSNRIYYGFKSLDEIRKIINC